MASKAAGISLLYVHSARFTISPRSASAQKLRAVLPYFVNKKAGELTYLPTPPATKPGAAPSANLNIWVALTEPGKAVEGVKEQGPNSDSMEVTYTPNSDSMEVTYTDGTVLKVQLDEIANVKVLVARVEKHSKTLRLKAEALMN